MRLLRSALFVFALMPAQAALRAEPPLVVEGLGEGTVALGGAWEFKTGDDLAWAAPGFDDSGWERIGVDRPWGSQTHFRYTGYAWYRRHIDFVPVAGAKANLAMFVPQVDDAYEAYWNGKLVGHFGVLPPEPVWYLRPPPHTFGLGASGPGVLAVRVWKSPASSFDPGTGGGFAGAPLAGSSAAIAGQKAEYDYRWLRGRQYLFALSGLDGLVGFLGLLAWLKNRDQKLLLWMALFSISPVIRTFLLGLPFLLSFSVAMGVVQPLFSLSDVSLWFVLLYLLQLDERPALVRWTRSLAYISFVSTCIDGALSAVDWSGRHVVLLQAGDGVLTAIFTVLEIFPLVLIGFAVGKRLSLARWLVAIFAFLTEMISVVRIAATQGERFTHWTLGEKIARPLFVVRGNPFTLQTVASTLLFFSIVYAVYRYSVEQGARQGALEQEFRSAQELQRVLIPETLPPLPGYAVTSAYQPAQEVGGDFFQVIAQADGAALLVLGDVSGKGLKAAMTVSLIVGAVRSIAEMFGDPAEILSRLNRRLHGRLHIGFVTCVILRLDPDGGCVLANAGHLAPFLNAQEVVLPPALPLGIVADAEFESMAMQLGVGDRLTLYTDGLLEARSAAGELYGFDRLRALFATQPDAQAASEAAVAFGQDDDITVLTVTRLAVGVESTTRLVAPVLVAAV